MVQKAADIERIVRDVLADLGLVPAGSAPSAPASTTTAEPAAPTPSPTKQPTPATRPPGDVVVADRVVTLAGIGTRLASARRLVVPPRAVVTPAVRDELRRRNVTLVVEDTAKDAARGGRVALTVLGSRIDPKPLNEDLERHGMAVDVQRFDCLVRATDDMAKRLPQTGATGVLLSNYGAVAMCLANRHQGVRAILASDESRTATDAVSVGANLLVAEPRRMAPDALRQIVSAFCRQGPGECPEELLDRLV